MAPRLPTEQGRANRFREIAEDHRFASRRLPCREPGLTSAIVAAPHRGSGVLIQKVADLLARKALARSSCVYPSPGRSPLTSIRVVRPPVVDYTKVRRINRLADEIEAGLPVPEAAAAFEHIRSAPHPCPRWVSMVGNAGVGPAATLLFTTNWKIIVLTFLTGCVVHLMLRVFDRRRVPPFFQQLAAAGLITMVAVGSAVAGAQRLALYGFEFFTGLQ